MPEMPALRTFGRPASAAVWAGPLGGTDDQIALAADID